MAYVNLLEVVYPVGSIYMTTLDTSPAETIGGTWTQLSGVDIGIPLAKTIYNGQGGGDTFKAYQVGNLLIYHGLAPFMSISPWAETIVFGDHRFPTSKYGYYGGSMANQETGYEACVIVNDNNDMTFFNKNNASLGQYYYGGGTYLVEDDEVLSNDLGVKMWKRIS